MVPTKKQLLGIRAHRFDMETNARAILFDDIAQVHRQGLKDKAEMLFEDKRAMHAQTVVPIVRVGLVQLVQ